MGPPLKNLFVAHVLELIVFIASKTLTSILVSCQIKRNLKKIEYVQYIVDLVIIILAILEKCLHKDY